MASTRVKKEEVDAGGSAKYPYLASLNAAQLKAVTADPQTPVQILAGPGSGKTRVLTSRVAYLVQRHGFRPFEITAVTFTNKAANEMRKRLEALLGTKEAGQLVLGTFHATCVRYLRRYGQMIGLPNNFSISDAEDCKKLMSSLIKAKSEILEGARMSLKDSVVLSEISKAKAKGQSPEQMAVRAAQDPSTSTSTLSMVAELYAEYEIALREANSLDFDDLLLFGLRLFREVPSVLATCRHILVDEFQDTNSTQYELMRCFAKAHGGVSVVGDPDQSIYGWRSAEVENLNKMTTDFPGVEAIYLEENYRSTGSILKAAHAVVSQDRERIPKSLFTSHPSSTPVNLKNFSTPVIEASFISTEIKRLIAYSGGVLHYGDFAILLRYNALSRVIESTLQKDSIPNRIVGGHKFFERMEIKDLLAYLQLAENPNFSPAFMRVINVPRRGLGDKSIADLTLAAKLQSVSPMELCERVVDGDALPSGIKPGLKKNIAAFVGVIRKLRRAAERATPVADLLRMVIEKTGYEEYLRTSQQDFDSRWENVQELISYSVTVAEAQLRESASSLGAEPEFLPASSAAVEAMVDLAAKKEVRERENKLHPMFRRTSGSVPPARSRSTSTSIDEKPRVSNGDDEKRKTTKRRRGKGGRIKEEPIEVLSSDDDDERVRKPANGIKKEEEEKSYGDGEDESAVVVPDSMTPLSYFLQTSMLSTDTDADKDEKERPRVTITTVHAAKGLEWPVVFIPAVEQGTYPSYRCTEPHEIAEERRLLYVAMTRAQVFLTMSHCQYRMMGGEESDKSASEFVETCKRKDATTFDAGLPDIDFAVRRSTASMLDRPFPDEEETKELIRKHVRAAPPLSTWDAPEPRDKNFNRFARRDVTKATRAAEYWASDLDEYALPDAKLANKNVTGFTSARAAQSARDRMSKPYNTGSNAAPRSPPKPVLKLPQRDHRLPEPMPFSFGAPEDKKTEAGLGLFTNASSSGLALMKSLGLPGEDDSPATSPGVKSPGLGGSPLFGGDSSAFPSKIALPSGPRPPMSAGGARSSMLGNGFGTGDAWKSLAQPSVQAEASGSIPLAKGTARLGMGRPAPWGSKR